MNVSDFSHGSFTLPGEAGYEDLTLRLAETWGADTIRDSDGTQLSDKILKSGYDIYSTLCLVRGDNEWAKAHPQMLQQSYLMSFPVTAESDVITIEPLEGFFKEQFRLNTDDDPAEWWQVHDRTTGEVVPVEQWSLEDGTVKIRGVQAWHRYTVNFLAYRIWEEISMYNHVTNDWGDREHLMPIDPIHPEVRAHMLRYLDDWLTAHPHTNVVRFTSMFYNFFWPWGDSEERRFITNDWGSYEFSVSPTAIRAFEKKKGYRPQPEDFINGGRYCTSHAVPSPVYRDWIDFIHNFVVDFSRECVERVQAAGKKAYVFYNDHWIGLEPTLSRFTEIGFDGIIDGIFNGFEARKVAETPGVRVRELRFHPYFFPTGVNGAPSFLPGGNPTEECQTYWLDIRRALLRKPVDRMGFGGFLHLVDNHPPFIEYVTQLAQEFRQINALHTESAPYTAPLKVALLTAWGGMRAWACCGHFNRDNYYNEVMESLAGLPVEVSFVSFEDLLTGGVPADLDVLVNAGSVHDAWTGGDYWRNPKIVEIVSSWVGQGGGFIGIGEPTAAPDEASYFQLAHILGVERVQATTRSQHPYLFAVPTEHHFITADLPDEATFGKEVEDLRLSEPATTVLAASRSDSPRLTVRSFGRGRAIYLAGHRYEAHNIRLIHRALFWVAQKESHFEPWTSHNPHTECAFYPGSRTLVVVNNTMEPQTTEVQTSSGQRLAVELSAAGSSIQQLKDESL